MDIVIGASHVIKNITKKTKKGVLIITNKIKIERVLEQICTINKTKIKYAFGKRHIARKIKIEYAFDKRHITRKIKIEYALCKQHVNEITQSGTKAPLITSFFSS